MGVFNSSVSNTDCSVKCAVVTFATSESLLQLLRKNPKYIYIYLIFYKRQMKFKDTVLLPYFYYHRHKSPHFILFLISETLISCG